ncbi:MULTISPECIES: zinc-binding dehydrogenase [Streptomyces]|nr:MULTISPECIES: zinc-binding dehydrogenase [Streptomyces]
MNEVITEHGLRPVIDRVFPFEEAPGAYAYYAGGTPFGKVVVQGVGSPAGIG